MSPTTLTPGTRLGPFEIVDLLGVGGMGEVYRATDTNLKRQVAIKVLPASVATDPDRLARFQREAEVLAALNHPNIAHIHGLEKSGGTFALVMELVEGPTLADRISQGAIPLTEALPIAKQIADALEVAHEQGIIHRDLKPANIKVRADSAVKVLDFGLAKAMDPAGPYGINPSISPTIAIHATQAGIVLGTAAYMSPEQARGRTVDRRTDIWAYGVVLFEMLTGRQAFPGDSITDIISAITRDEPDWNALPAETPPYIRALLRRCLHKDPQKRLPHIGVARIEIEEAPGPDVSYVAQGFSPAVGRGRLRQALPWAIAATALALFVVALRLWAPWRATRLKDAIRLEAAIGADASLVTDAGSAAVISPDGTLLAFVGQKGSALPQLFVRHIDHLEATVLPGTDDARSPFFSPDGQWIGFFADGKLKKVSLTGGAPFTVCEAANGRGGSWADDGTIIFQPSNTGTGTNLGATLLAVSSAGGQPRAITASHPEDEASQRWPQVLPGGRWVLYTAPRAAGSYGDARVSVQSLTDHTRKVLVQGAYAGRYVSSGHLLYLHEGTLFAAPFDLARLEIVGQAVPLLEHIATNTTVGSAHLSVSNDGTLIYVAGSESGGFARIAWLGRDGTSSPMRLAPTNWSNMSFSPDGRRLAMDITAQQSDIWVYDWDRDALQRLTFDTGLHQMPVWTPDGRRVVYRSGTDLFWVRSDGGGSTERLATSPNNQWGGSWHPSGKLLAYTESHAETSNDIMILPFEDGRAGLKAGKPTPFVNGPYVEMEPAFSPDGRWIAYSSTESGRNEVFVRPYPGPGGKWQISSSGGSLPTWSRARQELFFLAPTPDSRVFVVSYSASGDSFSADKPRPWSDTRVATRPRGIAGSGTGRTFDVAPDGERLAVALAPPVTEEKQDKLTVVFNFFDELRRLAPIK